MKTSTITVYLAALAAFATSASPLRAGSPVALHTPHSTQLPTGYTTMRSPIPQMSPIAPHNPPVTAPTRQQAPALPVARAPMVVISPIAPHNPPVLQSPKVQSLTHAGK